MTDGKKNRNLGVIPLREKGKVAVRGRIPAGVMTASQMAAVALIAEEFGNGEVAMTARLNVEIPFVNRRDAGEVAERLREAGIEPGSTGATLRSVVACKGTVCRHGCCDTQGLARVIEERYGGCELPRKLKISIAGCPNNCARVQLNDIGIMGRRFPVFHAADCEGCGACEKVCREGAVRVADGGVLYSEEDCIGCGDCVAICPEDAIGIASEGLRLYIGGRSGRVLQVGVEAEGLVAAEEIPGIVGRLLDYIRENAQPGERLGDLMERMGVDEVFAAAGMIPER
ncbi:MAG TPA: 4Fe-4S binding protein [Candidatus Methanoculleus thermohydrogenotrophicum]|jgi:dissimilatory sulfite reductase (desulfoviridin) alpha/beta subunit|nr:4Fe-4S binding protein [Candidatus Methanoculleus thermohydrogenotrophicum]NLM82992.1 4Fe-4S binding protein [Candidatus Methanoculleus thermohydrogenotrophicum]HOB17448.1 4Fe-4S binding protein [Candidatus Methanoculleus thermohydrogenotrophicum]HPZ37564.1 4Fe-4S binding protein [Candidatus Methanoculleus thermohydrogenotrophicum]HQC90696.1 4Fe-4S binding protein [Candidatus Methanoculleus thermohydrogenotrophicum]